MRRGVLTHTPTTSVDENTTSRSRRKTRTRASGAVPLEDPSRITSPTASSLTDAAPVVAPAEGYLIASGVAAMIPIPMSQPDITSAERAAVLDVLSTSTLALGPRLDLFERRLSRYVGAGHGVGVSSGTAGLHLCIVAAGVGEGDVVLTTPFSFVASANCILYERARPVFVDIDPVTRTVDSNALEAAARELVARRRRPQAIRTVHGHG